MEKIKKNELMKGMKFEVVKLHSNGFGYKEGYSDKDFLGEAKVQIGEVVEITKAPKNQSKIDFKNSKDEVFYDFWIDFKKCTKPLFDTSKSQTDPQKEEGKDLEFNLVSDMFDAYFEISSFEIIFKYKNNLNKVFSAKTIKDFKTNKNIEELYNVCENYINKNWDDFIKTPKKLTPVKTRLSIRARGKKITFDFREMPENKSEVLELLKKKLEEFQKNALASA